jgi:hypothetical protein
MRSAAVLLALAGGIFLATVAAASCVGAAALSSAGASSHRKAPVIADDPAADRTHLCGFVSPVPTGTEAI